LFLFQDAIRINIAEIKKKKKPFLAVSIKSLNNKLIRRITKEAPSVRVKFFIFLLLALK
jgi:hypothetical protein